MTYWKPQEACKLPTPYLAYHFRNIFDETTYELLKKEFESYQQFYTWAKGSEPFAPEVYSVLEKKSLARRIFDSKEIHTLFSDFFQIPLLPFAELGFHYHEQGHPQGAIHNDYLCVQFAKPESKTHAPLITFGDQTSHARALACIYYLNNDWANNNSDGGTGLYEDDRLIFQSSPVNNSAVIFECSPNGLHSSLANTEGPRSSIIAWYLAETEALMQKYGRAPYGASDRCTKEVF